MEKEGRSAVFPKRLIAFHWGIHCTCIASLVSFVRSPNSSNSNNVRNVNTDRSSNNNNNAYNGNNGVRPDLVENGTD